MLHWCLFFPPCVMIRVSGNKGHREKSAVGTQRQTASAVKYQDQRFCDWWHRWHRWFLLGGLSSITFKKGGWKNILSVSFARACSGCPAPSVVVPSQITGNTSVPLPPDMTRVMEANSCQISFSCGELKLKLNWKFNWKRKFSSMKISFMSVVA